MIFNRHTFTDFVRKTEPDTDIYQCIEILVTPGIVHTNDSQIFYFSHENFHDFLWSYGVHSFAEENSYAACLHVPTAKIPTPKNGTAPKTNSLHQF